MFNWHTIRYYHGHVAHIWPILLTKYFLTHPISQNILRNLQILHLSTITILHTKQIIWSIDEGPKYYCEYHLCKTGINVQLFVMNIHEQHFVVQWRKNLSIIEIHGMKDKSHRSGLGLNWLSVQPGWTEASQFSCGQLWLLNNL